MKLSKVKKMLIEATRTTLKPKTMLYAIHWLESAGVEKAFAISTEKRGAVSPIYHMQLIRRLEFRHDIARCSG